jgi:biotin carboxyl carrier protein
MWRRRLLLWSITLGALGVLLTAAFFVNRWMGGERAREGDAVQRERLPRGGVIKISPASAQAMGLAVDEAKTVAWSAERTVYGRVVPNPQATVEVRSPYGGSLRLGAGQAWPAPGERVHAGQPLGWLEVRVTPQERLDLQTKLSDARFKQQGAEMVHAIQQERVARFEKSASTLARNELDQALVQRADAWTQLVSARAAAEQYQQAVDHLGRPGVGPWSQLLTAPLDGEVVELTARPDMNVEAGAVLLRITDPRSVLVRLDLPPDALSDGPPPRVNLSLGGTTPPGLEGPNNRNEPAAAGTTVPAVLVGQAPAADAASQLLGFWYRLTPSSHLMANVTTVWRPGLFVQAALPTGAKRTAVSVADGALLYHQGRALVYVRIDARVGRYERREVRVLGRDGNRWALAEGVEAGEMVVSRRAQALLSEEFRGDVDND